MNEFTSNEGKIDLVRVSIIVERYGFRNSCEMVHLIRILVTEEGLPVLRKQPIRNTPPGFDLGLAKCKVLCRGHRLEICSSSASPGFSVTPALSLVGHRRLPSRLTAIRPTATESEDLGGSCIWLAGISPQVRQHNLRTKMRKHPSPRRNPQINRISTLRHHRQSALPDFL